ncbi:MAG: TonB-dependent receptor [Candidatus Omnitrophica bacterium]|nr:TonB-dependent receptor [Candidatus Omnitrophota bacterium]
MKRLIFVTLATMILVSPLDAYTAEEGDNVELERIVVTPIRSEQTRNESASNITIIDAKDIERSTASNVADILKAEVGVSVSGYTGSRKTANVDIRGFGESSVSNVLVLVNGRKVNQIDISGTDWCQIPIEAVEKIEVLRGAGTVLYGDNAVGGVVNIITKKGKGELKGKLGTAYGSYNTFSAFNEFNGSINKFSYYVHSKYKDAKGYRENNTLRTRDFNGHFAYPLFERLGIDLELGSHKDSYGMPGALSEGDMRTLGRRQSTYMEDRALTKDRYARLRLDAEPIINDVEIGNIVNDFSFRRRKSYTSSIAWGVNSITQNNIHTITFSSKYEKDTNLADNEIKLIAGIDCSDVDNELAGRGWSVDEINISKKSIGAYMYCEDKLSDRFIISGGYRYEKNKYVFDQSSAAIKYTKRDPSDSVIQASFVYLYDKDTSIFCDYKQSFRFPATDEWYINSGPNMGLNEDLKHQEGEQYELGIRHNLSDSSQLTASGYILNIKNEIYYDPSTFFNQNYDRTRHAGIELGMDLKLCEQLKTFANYTFEQARFRDGDYKNNDIPAVPRDKLSAGLKVGPLKNYYLSLFANYTGRRYMISDQKNQVAKMDDYITVDGKVLYSVKNIELFFSANNIFNEQYSEYGVTNGTGTAKNFYPSPERNFEIGASYRF